MELTTHSVPTANRPPLVPQAGSLAVPSTAEPRLVLRSLKIYDQIKLKDLKEQIQEPILAYSSHYIIFGEKNLPTWIVFRFGCLVFVNAEPLYVAKLLEKLKMILGNPLPDPAIEDFEIKKGPISRVEFGYVELKDFYLSSIVLISKILAQSAALDRYELMVDNLLENTNLFIKHLSKKGKVPLGMRKLLKMIGHAASTRQEIISQLEVMDSPEETWESKDLYALYDALEDNFDIHYRSKTLDSKLRLIQDNIELLVNFSSSNRTNFLETLIVALIIVEIGLAFIV